MLFDSHTHFNNEDLTDKEREILLNEMDEAVRDGKMAGAVDIGFDLASSELAAFLYCFLGAVYRVFIFGAYTQRKMRTAVSVGMAWTLHRERGFLH